MNSHALRLPSLAVEHPFERIVRHGLLAALILAVALYVYLIASSTFNIIERKQAESESITIETRLARISDEYYALSDEMSIETAGTIGLVPLEDKEYVTRANGLGLLSQ